MCTVTWFPTPSGYQLFCNRDESPQRKTAQPPDRTIEDGMPVLMPRDGEHGGSWIAVNQAGLSLTLLNNYRYDRHDRAVAVGERISRGVLLEQMSSSRSIEELRGRIRSRAMDSFEPWIILALVPNEPAAIFSWDGNAVSEAKEGALRLLTSSSWKFDRVAAYREKWFRQMTSGGRSVDPEAYLDFHRQREVGFERESVCVVGESVQTVSLTRIMVSGAMRRMDYCPGRPDQHTFLEALSMNEHG